MMTFSLIVGIILLFWGGFDLAMYVENDTRRNLVYCVFTTVLGIVNILLASGVLK